MKRVRLGSRSSNQFRKCIVTPSVSLEIWFPDLLESLLERAHAAFPYAEFVGARDVFGKHAANGLSGGEEDQRMRQGFRHRFVLPFSLFLQRKKNLIVPLMHPFVKNILEAVQPSCCFREARQDKQVTAG